MKKELKSYAVGLLIPLAVGGLSAFLTRKNMDIYESITKPSLAPPSIAFPIAWTVLYILMGLGSVMIYNNSIKNIGKRNRALTVYGIQLVINFFWSIIFFNLHEFLFSFIWLIALWALIILMIAFFAEINKSAAFLQIPYLLWVTFAGYLNFMIYLLN